ncbi:MAG: zinc-ribbon domain-containing protein [Rhodospirillaceae bacterium]
MALIECKDCNKQISQDAKTCPQCGAKVPRAGLGMPTKILLGFTGLAAAFLIFGAMQPETPRSRAREQCWTLERRAYTPAEKAIAETMCGELMRRADREMGRAP